MKWNEATLGELAERDGGLIQTGPFGSQLHQSDYTPEGIPVIMPTDISDGRVSTESVARVSEETVRRLSRHKVKLRAVVLPRRGEITKRAFIRPEQAGWLCGSGCLKIEMNGRALVPEFLYYFMDQAHVVQWLVQHAVGATMLNLSAGIVNDLPIRYPAIEVQRRIAEVLTAYDELMENNRRRTALLEEAARQLYAEWFVRLRYPGHERARRVDALPKGWTKRPLDELADVNRETLGGSFHGELEYVDISAVTPGRIGETTRYDFADAPSRARRVVRHGDIIWSCVRPSRRSHAVIWKLEPQLIVSTGFAVLTPKTLPTSYLYQATTTDAFVGNLENRARGAAYPAVVARDFEDSEIVVPPAPLVNTFNDFAEPVLAQLQTLTFQTQKLRAARDLLLPRLMSGELAV